MSNPIIQRIDLLMPPFSQYGVLQYFTTCFADALEACGVSCRVLEAEYSNPKPFVDTLMEDRPDCTLSFNGLLPDDDGNFFCDLINIPHVACLVDSPNRFVLLARSAKTIITCVDEGSCRFFTGIKCPNVFFMPHAADPTISPEKGPRPYDICMLATCIDYEEIRKGWKDHPKAIQRALEEAAEESLNHEHVPYLENFVNAIDRQMRMIGGINPRDLNLPALLQELEDYINGVDRIALLKNISTGQIHLFGENQAAWKRLLGAKAKEITIHPAISHDAAVKVMCQSKVVLNSCPSIREGGHERFFNGAACGAVLFSSGSQYLRRHFTPDEEYFSYQYGERDKLNAALTRCLSDEPYRQTIAATARKKVMEQHTFLHRARAFLDELAPRLAELKAEEKSP